MARDKDIFILIPQGLYFFPPFLSLSLLKLVTKGGATLMIFPTRPLWSADRGEPR